MISVVIVDDHALLREGTRQILERAGDLEVAGEAGDGEEAVAVVAATRPDVVLLDVRLPPTNGVEVARRVAGTSPGSRVLMLERARRRATTCRPPWRPAPPATC